MPAPQTEYANFASGNVNVPLAAETVIATTRSVSSPSFGAGFIVKFFGIMTFGAAITAVTYQIRRGSLTGTSVWSSGGINATAGQSVIISGMTVDFAPGEIVSGFYVVTVTQANATGNGTASQMGTSVTTPA